MHARAVVRRDGRGSFANSVGSAVHESLLKLQDGAVPFVAADMPDANEMTVGIMAVVAQQEAKAISQRTKGALAAAKARGTKLGGFRANAADIAQYQAKGVQATREKAQKAAEDNRDDVEPMVREGLSLRMIAARLNDDRTLSPRGGAWSAQAVKNLIERLGIDRA